MAFVLRRKDVNTDHKDKYDANALWRATCRNHVEVVRVLVSRDDVDVNSDARETTPLWWAIKHGNQEMKNILNARGAVV